MAQDSSNSTMEMGTSDQVLVAKKGRKRRTYILGAVAMLVVVGIVVALVVVLSGNEGGAADDSINTTEGPTSPVTMSSTTTTSPATPPEPPTTPTPDPPDPEIELEDIINGVFATPSFNGTWYSGNEILFRNANGDLVLYDVDADSATALITNTSTILQQSARMLQLSPDRAQVVLAYNVAPVYRHSFLARYSTVDILTGAVTDITPPDVNASDAYLQNLVWGPSGTSLAFVFLNNIYYQSSVTSEPQQITTSGVANIVYHGIPDWVYEEEVFGSNNALWFSADGTKLAYASFDDTDVRIMKVPHYGVPGSLEYQYTQHHEIRYPKPGTRNPSVSVTLRDLAATTSNVYSEPTDLDQPILRNVRFVNNVVIALMWTNRVQNHVIVELCTQGEPACIRIFQYTEANGWIDNIPLIFNEAGTSFVTILPQSTSEDGGNLFKQIVQVSETTVVNAEWIVQSRTNTANTVLDILEWTSDDIIWYKATSVGDSAEQHIYTVNPEHEVSCFTCNIQRADGGECLYNEGAVSVGGTRVTVNCAGPSIPQVFIYDSSANLVRLWDENRETAEMVATRSVPAIIRMSVPVAAGLPEADVHIQVPSDYEQRTNVPLLVYVYGGPDSSLVTKQWSIDWGTSLVDRWNIAVAHIDGRGSGLRGVENTFSLNRQLGTVEIDDQITVTRFLQENLPWVDGNRTCIWGWSYGGYAASLALARGGSVFRCAAAVAPVVDWRLYDTIYTERYMDLPENNVDAYAHSSLLTDAVAEAYRDKRYFLIHGTADDNVHYQHAMAFSRLLQRRDVYFTQMSYTDEDHGLVGVRPHLYHALEKFLSENML